MIVVHDANAIIEDTTADEIIWFWYNQDDTEEPVMSTFTAIASSNLYRYRLVSPEFPKLYDYLRFEPNTNIALLWDDDPTTWDKVIDTLAIYCQEPTILADKLLKQGSIPLNMTSFSTDWIPNHEFQSDC
jgi:hypothetical protein